MGSNKTRGHLVKEHKLFSMVFQNSKNGILIADVNAKIELINSSFTKITGYTLKEIKGKNPKILKSGRQDRVFYKNMWASIIKNGYWQGKIWNRRKDGTVFPEWQTIHAVKNKREITNYFAIFSDITDTRLLEENIQRLKRYDSLTNLPNRTFFYDVLDLAIADAKRNQQQFAVHIISLDNLEKINNLFGFYIGDTVIQKMAKKLKAIVNELGILARFDENKFIVIQYNIKNSNDAAVLANNLLGCVKKPLKIEKNSIYLTLSIGISDYPHCAQASNALIKNASIALDHAKEMGDNNFNFFSKTLNIITNKFFSIEGRLHDAIDKKEFLLYYQPQVAISTGEIVGVEALLRWIHPKLGMLLPDKFISIAEKNGLIIPIGEWVLKTACYQNMQWQKKGLAKIPVAVNISPIQINRSDIKNTIMSVLKETKLAAEFLEVELTESAAMKNPKEMIGVFQELKSKGIKISIDDFGTGYSSLSYLKRFPIGKLKIDLSFVKNVVTDPDAAAVCSAIIGIAKTLKLKVIAEGVETRDQLIILRSQQCDEIQGYLFSKPLSADDFEKILRAGKKLRL